MRNLRKSVAALTVACMLSLSNAALAEPVAFSPDPADKSTGYIFGQMPIASLGSLKLPQGMAVFNGRNIEIQAVPDWLFDRDVVLSGCIIRSAMTTNAAKGIFNGLVYFNDGSWIKNLASTVARDTIETKDGGNIPGNIQAILPDGLEILQLGGGRRKVLFSDIADINSPRAFKFAASAEALKLEPNSTAFQGESIQLVFVGTQQARLIAARHTSVPRSNLPGAEGGISNDVIAAQVLIDVAVNVIAPGLVLPLVTFDNRNAETKAKLRAIQAETGTFGPINP